MDFEIRQTWNLILFSECLATWPFIRSLTLRELFLMIQNEDNKIYPTFVYFRDLIISCDVLLNQALEHNKTSTITWH